MLGYDYAARLALLQDPPESGPVSPHLYVLCGHCAERLRPPQGWLLDDTRSEPPLFVTGETRNQSVALDEVADEVEPTVRRQLFFGYSA